MRCRDTFLNLNPAHNYFKPLFLSHQAQSVDDPFRSIQCDLSHSARNTIDALNLIYSKRGYTFARCDLFRVARYNPFRGSIDTSCDLITCTPTPGSQEKVQFCATGRCCVLPHCVCNPAYIIQNVNHDHRFSDVDQGTKSVITLNLRLCARHDGHIARHKQ
jgi:hypothetical protein